MNMHNSAHTLRYRLVLAAVGLAPIVAAAQSEPAYEVAERGPFWRTWTRMLQETNSAGEVYSQRHSYVELQDGLC